MATNTEPVPTTLLQETTNSKNGGKIISFHGGMDIQASDDYNNTIKGLSEHELRLECARLKSENSTLLFFISEKNLLPEYIESRSRKQIL